MSVLGDAVTRTRKPAECEGICRNSLRRLIRIARPIGGSPTFSRSRVSAATSATAWCGETVGSWCVEDVEVRAIAIVTRARNTHNQLTFHILHACSSITSRHVRNELKALKTIASSPLLENKPPRFQTLAKSLLGTRWLARSLCPLTPIGKQLA